jgi:CRP/FNR family transcriptional regulator
MTNKVDLSSVFEPELVKEIFQFGDIKHFKEGDVIMDYGKYVRMMPIITKGTVKVFRMDDTGKELLLYYLTNNESCSMAYSCCLEAKEK